MSLYNKRIGCGGIICCETNKNIKNILNEIINKILINEYKHGYPPNDDGANIVINILNNKNNYNEWINELYEMHTRIQKMRKLLKNKLINIIKIKKLKINIDWNFITKQVGMFAGNQKLFNKKQIEILKNEYHIYITDNGRISMGCITNKKQIDYLANSIISVIS